ncbi:hypothetical protein O0Q50_23065 [Priestia aryabhattai]|uniref:Uncharacterized protein n=1 Tax=Priestia aryabhattai TaxID=412384 RepID=A0AAX6NE56_PRIAR|nr:hypothetical protein [Priestia aryabhattai]MDU9694067.1 hypothetical protein [Priestia aryabhattai]
MKKSNLIMNVCILVLGIVSGIITYQTIDLTSFKSKSILMAILFTKLNVSIVACVAYTILFLFVKTLLTSETKSFGIPKFLTWEAKDAPVETVLSQTETMLSNSTFLNSFRIASQYPLLASVERDQHINVFLKKIVEEIHLFWKNESGLNLQYNMVEYNEIEDETIKELFEESLESGKAEIMEQVGLVKKSRVLLYAYEFEDKQYAVIFKSYKALSHSDAEFVTAMFGMGFDWYAYATLLLDMQEGHSE